VPSSRRPSNRPLPPGVPRVRRRSAHSRRRHARTRTDAPVIHGRPSPSSPSAEHPCSVEGARGSAVDHAGQGAGLRGSLGWLINAAAGDEATRRVAPAGRVMVSAADALTLAEHTPTTAPMPPHRDHACGLSRHRGLRLQRALRALDHQDERHRGAGSVVVARFSRAKALSAVATSRLMRADLYAAQPTSPVRRLVRVAMGAKDAIVRP
jgi:hypothetical protein